MRNANELLLEKTIAGFEKFQKKRKNISDTKIPKNVLEIYQDMVKKLIELSKKNLT